MYLFTNHVLETERLFFENGYGPSLFLIKRARSSSDDSCGTFSVNGSQGCSQSNQCGVFPDLCVSLAFDCSPTKKSFESIQLNFHGNNSLCSLFFQGLCSILSRCTIIITCVTSVPRSEVSFRGRTPLSGLERCVTEVCGARAG